MTITGTVKTVQSVAGALNGASQIPPNGAVFNTRGPAGADGITPTIGENGNWFYGDVDSGYPSRGEKGDPGETPDTSIFALKADIAATVYSGFSNSSTIYVKISDFGAWGTGAWYQKGFTMLITTRAGEMVWLSLAATDSNTMSRAIRLFNTHSKINALYYSTSESAVYCKMVAWCNNLCAHILSNVNGDYVPTVAQAAALPDDAVEVNIVEFGVSNSGTVCGDTSVPLALGGSAERPTYNGGDMALMTDIPAAPDLSGYAKWAGGKFTGAVEFNNVDGASVMFTNGIYINQRGGKTLLGSDGSNAWVGMPAAVLMLRGSASRPTYNGANVALASDIPSAETWTFTLDDGSTVTKAVRVG